MRLATAKRAGRGRLDAVGVPAGACGDPALGVGSAAFAALLLMQAESCHQQLAELGKGVKQGKTYQVIYRPAAAAVENATGAPGG